jgi:hypothetical protein
MNVMNCWLLAKGKCSKWDNCYDIREAATPPFGHHQELRVAEEATTSCPPVIETKLPLPEHFTHLGQVATALGLESEILKSKKKPLDIGQFPHVSCSRKSMVVLIVQIIGAASKKDLATYLGPTGENPKHDKRGFQDVWFPQRWLVFDDLHVVVPQKIKLFKVVLCRNFLSAPK